MKEYINANNTYEVRGTSAEDKPVGKYPPFTVFHEMDTGADYYLDEVSNTWKPVGGGGEYDMVIEADFEDFTSAHTEVWDYSILSGSYARCMAKLNSGEKPKVLIKTKDYYNEDMFVGVAEAIAVCQGVYGTLNIQWGRGYAFAGASNCMEVTYNNSYLIAVNSDNEIAAN